MKFQTLDQIEQIKDKAVRFVRDVVGDPERADEFVSMSPEEYAEHNGVEILDNPRLKRKEAIATTKTTPQSEIDDLQETLDGIADILDEALDAELTREEVIAKVKEAYDMASGEEDEEETDDEDAGDDDDEDPGVIFAA